MQGCRAGMLLYSQGCNCPGRDVGWGCGCRGRDAGNLARMQGRDAGDRAGMQVTRQDTGCRVGMLLFSQRCGCLGRDAGQGWGRWHKDAEQKGRGVVAWAGMQGMQGCRDAGKLGQG